ncbi:unnamed protein product [Scytosiphon promiscuus]
MWRSMRRPCLRMVTARGPSSRAINHATINRLLSGQADSLGGASTTAAAPKIEVREVTDTLDLIDQLLWVLGPADSGEAGYVFFDLDETLITRDTCLIDGLGSTSALIAKLEAKLGPSSETLSIIRQEMERDYYSAKPMLVDPLLTRVIRALKIQGHSVFGLTSNALDPVHAPQILETLARYKIRFSAPEIRGELPRSGALMLDHPVSRGIIFGDNQQAVKHDKGEIIAEYVGLLLHNAGRAAAETVDLPDPAIARVVSSELELEKGGSKAGGGDGGGRGVDVGSATGLDAVPLVPAPPRNRRPKRCVLVDNTSKKCERAAASFARHAALAGGGLELHTLHFTEAENLVDSPDALRQLRIILERLKARGLIDVDMIAENLLVTPVGSIRTGGGALAKVKASVAAAKAAFATKGEDGDGGDDESDTANGSGSDRGNGSGSGSGSGGN